jgi:hypothetical protein
MSCYVRSTVPQLRSFDSSGSTLSFFFFFSPFPSAFRQGWTRPAGIGTSWAPSAFLERALAAMSKPLATAIWGHERQGSRKAGSTWLMPSGIAASSLGEEPRAATLKGCHFLESGSLRDQQDDLFRPIYDFEGRHIHGRMDRIKSTNPTM